MPAIVCQHLTALAPFPSTRSTALQKAAVIGSPDVLRTLIMMTDKNIVSGLKTTHCFSAHDASASPRTPSGTREFYDSTKSPLSKSTSRQGTIQNRKTKKQAGATNQQPPLPYRTPWYQVRHNAFLPPSHQNYCVVT